MTPSPPVLHATVVALRLADGWRGVLLRGPSGVGKSDLALRAMADGWRLVADDRVTVWASGGRLYGRAPKVLSGLIEARGLGVTRAARLPWAWIALAVDLTASAEALERVPAEAWTEIGGIRAPRIALFAHEASAVTKLTLALTTRT